ncbi:YhhN-like protein [mine drainage metagenome]|uniref:YhhN-like protein n=1 Tax=mine drainage metagenome TaxID=410659 RepID=A0A1J5S7X7_9ZZZZ
MEEHNLVNLIACHMKQISMQMLKKIGMIIFWIALILNCYFIYSGQHFAEAFTKIALIPALLSHILLNTRNNHFKNNAILIFTAFICAWLGDILLLNKDEIFFLLGMLAFASAQILFAITFYRIHKIRISKSKEAFIAALILVAALYELYKFIGPNLGSFKIPILIYMGIIGTMAIMAVNLWGSDLKKNIVVMHFIPGALLFIISDALLALRLFMFHDIILLAVAVMFTYGCALSLFAGGFIKLLKK